MERRGLLWVVIPAITLAAGCWWARAASNMGAGEGSSGSAPALAAATLTPVYEASSPAVANLQSSMSVAPSDPLSPLTQEGTPRERRVTPIVQVVRRVGPTVVNLYADIELNRRSFFGGFDQTGLTGSRGDRARQRVGGHQRARDHRQLGRGRGSRQPGDRALSSALGRRVGSDELQRYNAKVLGIDRKNDLALLQIETEEDEEFAAAVLGTSSDLMVGETVVAVGNPYGREGSVTHGIISATNRDLTTAAGGEFSDLIQTDAPLNAGNSGGPLFNILGELIGINQAIGMDRQLGKADGQGLAIPVDRVRELLDNWFDPAYLRGLYLGAELREGERGLEIVSLESRGPMARAGARIGDRLLAVAGNADPGSRGVQSAGVSQRGGRPPDPLGSGERSLRRRGSSTSPS